MESATAKADELRRQIRETEKSLEDLRQQLHNLENAEETSADVPKETPPSTSEQHTIHHVNQQQPPSDWPYPLTEEEYTRYARQLILPSVGITGQLALKDSSILIIGAGGLGCPAAAYLAGAGVGRLGIVDGDTVETSNLHRQIGHSTPRVGQHKVHSLVAYCRSLNPLVTYAAHPEHLTPQNAERVVAGYDLVLDCTDHPTSRYLVSDVCVLLGKTLVSASALRTDGQLIVLNGRSSDDEQQRGPCYRCVFPKPPPADSVMSCGEGGILGPVVGVMGVLQALEAIKLVAAGLTTTKSTTTITSKSTEASATPAQKAAPSPSLLLFSAGTATTPASFRTIRMRGRRDDCFACSPTSSGLTLDTLRSGSLDYVAFCGVTAPVKILGEHERVSARDYYHYHQKILSHEGSSNSGSDVPGGEETEEINEGLSTGTGTRRQHVLLDVREREHFDIASLPGAFNVPFSKFQAEMRRRTRTNTTTATTKGEAQAQAQSILPEWLLAPPINDDEDPQRDHQRPDIYVICRLGNDSQVVARQLQDLLRDQGRTGSSPAGSEGSVRFIGDIRGGMAAWKRDIDGRIPFT